MDQMVLFKSEDPPKKKYQPKEFKVIALRECAAPEEMLLCDTPQRAAEYWNAHIATSPHFNPECECFVVLLLNTRRRVKGHHLVSIGTLESVFVHPREVFRTAVVAAASGVVLMHNLCAAAHKLCYVAWRVMCSRVSAAFTSTLLRQWEECHAKH
ncbi:MAG: JAB domain-containing protein [Limisphaerales bacterium]